MPALEFLEVASKTGFGRFEPGTGKKLGEALATEKFESLGGGGVQEGAWESVRMRKVAGIVRVLLHLCLW